MRQKLEEIDLRKYLKRLEVHFLEQYLNYTGGNKALAAKMLGMNRTTLFMRLKALKLEQWIKKDPSRIQ
jgi:DNA-binding protein Fis